MSYYKKYLKYKNKYLTLKQLKNLQGGSSFEHLDFTKLSLEELKKLAIEKKIYDESYNRDELLMILESYIQKPKYKQHFTKDELKLIEEGRELYGKYDSNYTIIPDETILKLMNESSTVAPGGGGGGGGTLGSVIEKVSVSRKRVDEIINQTKDNIRVEKYDDLFTKIEYYYGTGNLNIRKIDLLMLAPYHDGTRVEHNEIITLLENIPDEILLNLFNDDTLLYPHSGRPYLNLKKGSIMSTLLIQGYFDIYEYICSRLPHIILNDVDDLMILFNFILFRDRPISPDLDEINRKYRPLINLLKIRLEGDNTSLFSNNWFDEFILKCKRILDDLKKLPVWVNQKTNKDKSILLFTYLKRDPILLKLFTGHSCWEDTVEPVIDDGEYSLDIILDDDTINEEYIHIIRNIFNN